jgi:L-ascorbate metabolism protein UlaG (beta-lactamase superfamily)
MEIIWFGGSCVRLKGREGVVAADPFRSIVGPTGRGITADIVTYGHHDDAEAGRHAAKASRSEVRSHQLDVLVPTSLEKAFVLDSPGEYEVHDILATGVRTFRDGERGQQRGMGTSFVYELDGIYIAHLGDVGHVLTQEMIGELGHVDIACVGIGPQLRASHAVELIGQLDANLVVPMPLNDAAEAPEGDLARFLKEMNVTDPQPVPKLNVTISTVPKETTVVLLEQRGRT